MKVCDVWIFHVERGVAGAIRTPDGHWIAIDLGSSKDFCPVNDFFLKHIPANGNERRKIAQLIISHPHNDHMTALKRFDEKFYPDLLTVPNDNDQQELRDRVNWERIQNQNDELTNYLRENMLPGRQPPLRAFSADKSNGFVFEIYYLPPHVCENDDDLQKSNYQNNISILVRLNYKGNVVLFSGDMMKDGMKKLIDTTEFGNKLKDYGVDYLVAPHHGLRSSFSVDLFGAMKGGKSRINIISEKQTNIDSNEIVDDRYGKSDFASGGRVFIDGKFESKRKIRTSVVGHINIRLLEDKRTLVYTGDQVLAHK